MKNIKRTISLFILFIFFAVQFLLFASQASAGTNSGVRIIEVGNSIRIENDLLSKELLIEDGKLTLKEIFNKRSGECFTPESGSEEFIIKVKKEQELPQAMNKSGWRLVSVDSEHLWSSDYCPAVHAFDNNPNTIWHTRYSPDDPQPHYIVIDLGETKTFAAFSYLPRQIGVNGSISEYEFYISDDGENWGNPVSHGKFDYADGQTQKNVNFNEPVSGRYIKLVSKSEVNGKPWTSVAEISLYEEKLPELSDLEIKTSDLITEDVQVKDINNGEKVIFIFKPYTFDSAVWNISMEISMNDDDWFMRKKLNIECSNPDEVIDYIVMENMVIGEDDEPIWSRPENISFYAGLGQPVYISSFFFGCEFPAADNRIKKGIYQSTYYYGKAVSEIDEDDADNRNYFSTWHTVTGAARSSDQQVLKNDFLEYIKTIAVAPEFRIQYNSWYDYMYNINPEKLEKSFLETEKGLTQHGVRPIDSYVADDGWTDYDKGFWEFNSKFPDGFTNESELAKNLGSEFGVWIGPRGGYSVPTKYAKVMESLGYGYNPAAGDICTGHPKYIEDLTDRMIYFINEYGVNYFKLDGYIFAACPDTAHGHATGGPNNAYYYSDHWERWIDAFEELRAVKPDVYLNITSATFVSPWWLQWVNAVWLNNSSDMGFLGGGSDADQMLTYRDDRYYQLFEVQKAQFPAGYIYNHEPCYGAMNYNQGKLVNMSTEEFIKYLLMCMTRGTGFLELYYSPSMFDEDKWMINAEILKWGEENFHILQNAMMIGGNPANNEVYGYSSWSGSEGIISLRNPSGTAQSYKIKLDRLTGVTEGVQNLYRKTIYPYDIPDDGTFDYGDTIVVNLDPYEMVVWQFSEDADTVSPEIRRIKVADDETVRITFSERVNPAPSQDVQNYTIDGIDIQSAALLADLKTVELKLSTALQENLSYTLTASNISDSAGNSGNLSSDFTYYEDGIINEVNNHEQLKNSDKSITVLDGQLGIEVINLDGTKSYVINSQDSLKGKNDFTISMLVKTNDTESTVLAQDSQYRVVIEDGKIGVILGQNSVYSNNQINDNRWHHIAVVREINGLIKIYIDGKLNNSLYSSHLYDIPGVRTYVGSNSDQNNYYKGCLGQIRIIDYALDYQKILDISESLPIGGISEIDAVDITVVLGEMPILPEELNVKYSSGLVISMPVTWNTIDPALYSEVGQFTVEGTIEGIDEKARAVITVVEGITNDEFDTDDLKSFWNVINLQSDAISLTKNPGNLTISGLTGYSDSSENTQKNIIVQKPMFSDFVITTKVDFMPTANYQSAGLLIYQDEDNYIRLTRKVSGSRILSLAIETGGSPQYIEISDPLDGSIAYLALEKEGNSYRAYYSNDNNVWTQLGSSYTAKFDSIKVGIMANKAIQSAPDIDAKFDYFRYLPYAPTLVIEQANDVNVTTVIGKKPILPFKVKILLSDGNTKEVYVTWDDIDPEKYEKPGNFTVKGVITGTAAEVVANVMVTSDEDLTEAVIEGPDEVEAGKEFTVSFGIKNAKGVMTQDITVIFNHENLELLEEVAVDENVSITLTDKDTPGKVRIIVASLGTNNSITGDKTVLELKFKAKNTFDNETIVFSKISISDGAGNEADLPSVYKQLRSFTAQTDFDVNGDGIISIGDLGIVAFHYGKDRNSSDWNEIAEADIDRDGVININDIILLAIRIFL